MAAAMQVVDDGCIAHVENTFSLASVKVEPWHGMALVAYHVFGVLSSHFRIPLRF